MSNRKNFPKYYDKKMFINMHKEKMNEEFRDMRKEENLSNVVNTSERRILFYKTKICPWYIKGKCERKKTCLYAHAQNELRDLPNLCKTSLCPKLKINEMCNDKKCKYAHTSVELRATENLYKTALCESFIKGKCFSGQFCRYAHGNNELRENPMEITDKNIIIGTSKNKNEKLEVEKKKNINATTSTDIPKRNETYCIFPPKKDIYHNSNKLNASTEVDGVCDITETIDTQILNDITMDNSYECIKKSDYMFKGEASNNHNNNLINYSNYRNHSNDSNHSNYSSNSKNSNNSNHSNHSNNNVLTAPSPAEMFMKRDENSKFNDEQFLNDNLIMLGFLEDHNNVEKYSKNNHIINETGNSNNFHNNGSDTKIIRNNNDMSNTSSHMSFNAAVSHGKVDMNNHNNLEDNYYDFSSNNMNQINYEDIFFNKNSCTFPKDNNVMLSQAFGNCMLKEPIDNNDRLYLYYLNNHKDVNPNNDIKEEIINELIRDDTKRKDMITNDMTRNYVIRNENVIREKDIDNFDSWENFSLFSKNNALAPQNDYFKIFNYGFCNKMDNKMYDNCKGYNNQIDKFVYPIKFKTNAER